MLKVQVLYALALFSLSIVSCDLRDDESKFVHGLDADLGFTLFKNDSLQDQFFQTVKRIKDFYEEHATAVQTIIFLATIPIIYEEEISISLMLAADAIEEKGLIEGLRGIIEEVWNQILGILRGLVTALKNVGNLIKHASEHRFLGDTPEEIETLARDTLVQMVDGVFSQLVNIIDTLGKKELKIIAEKFLSYKVVVGVISGLIMKIIDVLGTKHDICKIRVNIKDDAQAFLLERFKDIRMDLGGDQNAYKTCYQEQRVFGIPPNVTCPDYNKENDPCTRRRNSTYSSSVVRTTANGKEILKDLFNSSTYFYIGDKDKCIYYYLCRVRENLQKAVMMVHNVANLQTDSKCSPGEKPQGNQP